MPAEVAAGPADELTGRLGPAAVSAWIRGAVLEAANGLIVSHGRRPLRAIEVSWDLRGRMAGQARLLDRRRGLVRMNRQLFELGDATRGEIVDTALHEVAHLCVFVCWPGASPHGARWRQVAMTLGARPRATHALPFSPTRVRREYAYQVGARLVWLGATRHRRLQAGQARYRCRTVDGIRPVEASAFTGEVRAIAPDGAIRRTAAGASEQCER